MLAGGVATRQATALTEVSEVVVTEPYRRQGVGRALLTRAVSPTRTAEVRLHTTATNPHRSFDLYTSVGFTLLAEHPKFRCQLR